MKKSYNLQTAIPDWNESNSKSTAFIKNRPFYTETKFESAFKQTLSFTKNESGLLIAHPIFTENFFRLLSLYSVQSQEDVNYLIKTKRLKIKIDQNEYINKLAWIRDTGGVSAGNFSLLDSDDPDTKENFVLITNPEEGNNVLIVKDTSQNLQKTVEIWIGTVSYTMMPLDFLPPLVGCKDARQNEAFNSAENITEGSNNHIEGEGSDDRAGFFSDVQFSNPQFKEYSSDYRYAHYTAQIDRNILDLNNFSNSYSLKKSNPYVFYLKLIAKEVGKKDTFIISQKYDSVTQTLDFFTWNPSVAPQGIYDVQIYTNFIQGDSSHIEGRSNRIIGKTSHCEGECNFINSNNSHVEGEANLTKGRLSHAEGYRTITKGIASHTEGMETIAGGDYSHVEGKANIEDSQNKYIHIAGNGDTPYGEVRSRSNAYTLDWLGNGWYQNSVTVAGTDMDTPDAKLEKDGIIIKSSTPNSQKHFKITVDDTGTLNAAEITL